MNNILMSGAVLFVMTSASLAADMPAPMPVEAVAMPFTWSGAYVGIHGGYAWGEQDINDVEVFDSVEGFVIGGHVGYNWQWDSIVFGIEGDGSFSDQEDDDIGITTEVDYLASVRGRLGFALDSFLIYGTGGAAFAGVTLAVPGDDAGADLFGWAAGGGIEYAMTDRISLGVEYLHYEFDDDDFTLLSIPGDANLTTDVVRGRVSMKFDSLFD